MSFATAWRESSWRATVRPWSKNQIQLGLQAIFRIVQNCNFAVVRAGLHGTCAKDPEKAGMLDAALYFLAESLRIVAILICPVLPRAAAGIFEQLQLRVKPELADVGWGGLPDGHWWESRSRFSENRKVRPGRLKGDPFSSPVSNFLRPHLAKSWICRAFNHCLDSWPLAIFPGCGRWLEVLGTLVFRFR